jgi:hypothetical protein
MVESIDKPRSRLASIAGLIVALGAPFVLGYVPGFEAGPLTDAAGDIRFIVFEWIVAFILLAIVIFWERLPLRSIGFRPLTRQAGVRVAITAAIYAALAIMVTLRRGNVSVFGLPTPAELSARRFVSHGRFLRRAHVPRIRNRTDRVAHREFSGRKYRHDRSLHARARSSLRIHRCSGWRRHLLNGRRGALFENAKLLCMCNRARVHRLPWVDPKAGDRGDHIVVKNRENGESPR